MDRRGHWAHDLARRGLALLTQHRLMVGVGILDVAGVIPVDPQPVHFTAVEHLILADDWDVVLGLAGDDARVTAGADVLIDRHAPGVAFVFEVAVHREACERLQLQLLDPLRILRELRRGGHPYQVAPFERPVILRRGKRVALAGLDEPHARQDVGCGGGAERIHVEAGPVARTPRARATVTEVQREGVGGLAGRQPHRHPNCAVALFEIDNIAADEREPHGRGRRHQRGVVPGELRKRFRKLLQPRVVREAAVVDARVRTEDDLQARRLSARRLSGGGRCVLREAGGEGHCSRRKRRVRDDAVVQPSAPLTVERRELGDRRGNNRPRRGDCLRAGANGRCDLSGARWCDSCAADGCNGRWRRR